MQEANRKISLLYSGRSLDMVLQFYWRNQTSHIKKKKWWHSESQHRMKYTKELEGVRWSRNGVGLETGRKQVEHKVGQRGK